MFTLDQHHLNSVLRENIVEHLFVGEALRLLWQSGVVDVEILRSEFDAYGYDVVISDRDLVRHVQLKTGTKLKSLSVSKLLSQKPSGCVVFIQVNDALQLGPYYVFQGEPGSPLPDLRTFKTTVRNTANSKGEKPQRSNHVDLTPKSFVRYDCLKDVLVAILGRSEGLKPLNQQENMELRMLPVFVSDEDAEHFVATADLSEYDLSGFAPANFEFARSPNTQPAERPPIPDQGNDQ